MIRSTRISIAVLALGLLAVLRLPLWHIELKAPQYPEGLGMYIWANQITGQKPNDLNSINGLNHYIGMQAIVPDAIPELRLMPLVVVALSITGLGVAALGKRSLFYAWTGVFAVSGLVGLIDFYRWGYNYGHNLDPHAAIVVPGMSYQPPILGTKQLLNFQAVSWPASGGWIAILVLTCVGILLVRELRRNRHVTRRSTPPPAALHTVEA